MEDDFIVPDDQVQQPQVPVQQSAPRPLKVTGVLVGNNPSHFMTSIPLKIEFICAQNFMKKIGFVVKYTIGSKDDDQVLAKMEVGPFKQGKNSVTIKCTPPNPQKMKKQDLLRSALILVEGFYKDQRFINVGYFVSNKLKEIDTNDNNNMQIDLKKIDRNILSAKPRVTRYDINWA